MSCDHRMDHYHLLEREHIHLTLLAEARKGWEDVEAGKVLSVDELRAKYSKAKARQLRDLAPQ